MTQVERIMQYIEDYGSISSMEAFRDLGITRLAARISDAEADGVVFNRTKEAVTNRYGEKVYFTRYSIAKQEGQDNENY